MKRAPASKPKTASKRAAKRSAGSTTSRVTGHFGGMAKPAPHRLQPAPAGYKLRGEVGLLVPDGTGEPVPASKIKRGIVQARQQLDETLHELLHTLTGPYEIKEIKLVASFNADGKFLGFGVGGAASMEITICPSREA